MQCNWQHAWLITKRRGKPVGRSNRPVAPKYMWGGEVISRLAHNQKVTGLSPVPATKEYPTQWVIVSGWKELC